MKTCFKCLLAKPVDEFYRHPRMADGHLGKCKSCAKADVKARSAITRVERSEYERSRNQSPARRAKKVEYDRRHGQRNPEKASARRKLKRAVASGKVVRQPCCYCGETQGIQGHHHDYSKPLDVRWVCFKCHREREHGQVVVSTAPF